ncbi:MAG: flippase-like domain-containing protein [Micrococcales bacterium]|nr:flippase-like domain-containing protein [Micrococcales bacterium]
MSSGPTPSPDGDGVTPNSSEAPSKPTRSRMARILFNKRVVKAVGIVLMIGLLYYAIFVVLPSEIDWSQVWYDIQALTPLQIVGLVAGGLLAMVTLGWTSKASLPKLTLFQGFESSATSQLSAFAFPPPADMAIRFAMYRTYGFTDEQSAVGVLIALVARYAAVIAMPLIGLAAVVVTGQGSWTGLAWLLGLGAAFMVVMWLIIRVARSESMAHATGRFLQRAADWIITKFHRTPPADLEQSVVKFGARTGSTIETNGRSLLLSNLSWGLANALVMAMALRFSGLDRDAITSAGVLFATGLTMAINMLPIPGKDALAVSWLAAILGITSQTDTSALGTGLLLYRVVTWILPMPVGGITFFTWRFRVRHDEVTTVSQ